MKALDNKVGEIYIYGEIANYDFWNEDTTPTNFKSDLDGLGEVENLNLYINSPGGSVFAGQAIYSMIKRHGAKVTVYVDGLAASIASVIAMAGDKIIIPSNAMLMIHNPWTISAGNSSEFRKLADDLDKIAESLVSVYQSKTGLEEAEIISMMNEETWLTGKEALEKGFADEVEEDKKIAASLDDGIFNINNQTMDLSMFKNAPKFIVTKNEAPEKKDPVIEAEDKSEEKKMLSLELELI